MTSTQCYSGFDSINLFTVYRKKEQYSTKSLESA